MKEAGDLPRGPILWIAIGALGLTITKFPLSWAFVFGFSFCIAHDAADFIGSLVGGWLAICVSIYLDLWRARRL